MHAGNFVWTEAAVHLLLDLVLEHRAMLIAAADYADEPWEASVVFFIFIIIIIDLILVFISDHADES